MIPSTDRGVTETPSPARGMETIPCDLCRSERSELVLQQRDLLLGVTDQEFRIVRCCECGLVYLNPRPSRDLIGTYYPTVYYPPVSVKERPPLQQRAKKFSAKLKRWVLEEYYGYPSPSQPRFLRFLKRALLWPDKALREFKGRHPLPWSGEGKVLDVGCGAGGNLKTLQDQGWNVSGIEISDVAAAHARALTGGQIHTGTLESHPFAPKTFDLILMSHSLEHLPSPADALRRVHSLLKDDGLLVVSVPNVNSLEAKLFGRWWFAWDPPRHFYHFGRSTLTQCLAQAGFEVKRFRTGVGAPFFMASLDRWWKQRLDAGVPMRKIIDRVVARPLCLFAGHAGYGTEMTVYAGKRAPTERQTTA